MRQPGVRLPERVEGRGVLLRRWRPADAEVLSQAVAESVEHLRPWMQWAAEEPVSLEDRRKRLEHWETAWRDGGDVAMGVFTQDGVVGSCGLHRRIGPGGLEIGYWIHPTFTRRGFATATAALLTGAAFQLPDIDRVEIHHDRANTASAGIPRKLGFRLIAQTPDEIVAPAEEGIDCIWRMGRADWSCGP